MLFIVTGLFGAVEPLRIRCHERAVDKHLESATICENYNEQRQKKQKKNLSYLFSKTKSKSLK